MDVKVLQNSFLGIFKMKKKHALLFVMKKKYLWHILSDFIQKD